MQEAQLHAEDIATMLPEDDDAFIGGRAKGASEALRQLQLAKKAAHERALAALDPMSVTSVTSVTAVAPSLHWPLSIPRRWRFAFRPALPTRSGRCVECP